MILEEINETNFVEKLEQGQKDLQVKFDTWDRIGKLKNSMTLDKFNKMVRYPLRDPTIWAYATLKDKQGNRLKVHPFQDKIMNDKNRFVHVHAANQIGKTWAAVVVKGLHHAIHVNNASVMIISAKEDQAIGILDEMKWMAKRARIDYDELVGDVSNRAELHLYFGKDNISVVRTFPPTTAILSFPSTLTEMDEDNFWEKIGKLHPIEFYDQCVEPRSNATKNWKHPFLTMGQIVGITNPNGKQGLGFRCLNDERYHNYIYCWLANPNNTLEEYLFHKKRLPSYRFASIYAATYEDVEGGFITAEQYEAFASYKHRFIIPPKCNLFLGLDVASEDPKGKNTDWHVMYGLTQVQRSEKDAEDRLPRLKVVYMNEWKPGTPIKEVYEEIRRLKDSGINISKLAYDKVGVGDKIQNDLIDRGILSRHNLEVLTYSLPNKSEVYINFQTMFEQGLIEGMDIPKLKDQIFGLKVEQPLGSVHLKIHHATEGIKDDHCFVAGTKVLTSRGNIDIEKITTNDYVITPFGKRRILATGNREVNKIVKLTFNNGITIYTTPDHKFYTNKRFIKSDALTNSCWLETDNIINRIKWKLKNIFIIKDRNMGFVEYITKTQQEKEKNFTEKFGRIIMERFQKAGLSITKRGIPIIMILQISNLCLQENIHHSITIQKNKKKKRNKILLNSQDLKLLNGINLKKEESGINDNIKQLWQMLRNISINVYSVIKSINQHESKKLSIVMSIAEKNIIEEQIYKKETVFVAPKKLKFLDILKSNIVRLDVLHAKEKKINVYNISVEQDKVYYANGFLTRNCDALANACFAAKRLIGVTPSFTALKEASKTTEEQSKSNKMYLLICPECESENYNDNNGYYNGLNPKGESLAKISCPMHQKTIETTI